MWPKPKHEKNMHQGPAANQLITRKMAPGPQGANQVITSAEKPVPVTRAGSRVPVIYRHGTILQGDESSSEIGKPCETTQGRTDLVYPSRLLAVILCLDGARDLLNPLSTAY